MHPITSVLLCVEHLIDLNSRQNYNRIVSLVVLLIGLVACDSYKYVTYKPHYLTSNSEHKYYGKAGLDSVEFANTKPVLTYYGEDYWCDVTQFHVYAVEWDHQRIKWFVDGALYYSANIEDEIGFLKELQSFNNNLYICCLMT